MTPFDTQAVDLSGILNKSAEEKAKQIPDPSTYHLLCVLPEIEEEYEAWYQRDHLRDRVGTPGFRSCRRYMRVQGDGRQYFTFSYI